MKPYIQENKRIIRRFMQAAYDDQHLAQLLDHARSGKLAFQSCCCFIGMLTADHEPKGIMGLAQINMNGHIRLARENFAGACEAEHAYSHLSNRDHGGADYRRRQILIPMILAEIQRRERSRHDHRVDHSEATPVHARL